MATQLNKDVTREVELATGESTDTKIRGYHVSLTKVRDALRDLYIIELMVDENVSDESLLKVTDSINKGDK
jgi:hypothetical protein